MESTEPPDAELLAAWLERRDERAFRRLVGRYAGLVRVAARRTCQDDQLAAEVSQNVFILLARNAAALAGRRSLAGWLHLTAVMQARNVARGARREYRKRELFLAHLDGQPGRDERKWNESGPAVDHALASLGEKDREALLLHYYRSLSPGEVAVALGIAPQAARKRIERATERLRRRLMPRSSEAGGAPMATLILGTAGESQVSSATVSLLAGKAAAMAPAQAVSTGIPILTALAAMKTSTLVPPAAALILAALFLASQWQALSAVEKESALLRGQIARADSGPSAAALSARRDPAGTAGLKSRPSLHWRDVATRLSAVRNAGGAVMSMAEMREILRVKNFVESMETAEIIATLDEIAGMELDSQSRDILEDLLAGQLMQKAPEVALDRFADRIGTQPDKGGGLGYVLATALADWARKDPAAAEAWFDRQIAAGKFESTALDGSNRPRSHYEAKLAAVLLGTDPAACASRIASLPERLRTEIFDEFANLPLATKDQGAYAALVRESLPPEKQPVAVARAIGAFIRKGGYSEASAFLDRIGATPAERAAGVEQAGARTFDLEATAGNGIDDRDLATFREWAAAETPGSEDLVLGKALGQISNDGFDNLAGLAERAHQAGGGDEVLTGLLEGRLARLYKPQARTLAGRIADPAERERILDLLK